MKYVSLFIECIQTGHAPAGWRKSKLINIQRLYYIKSGKGQYREKNGELQSFEAGHVYIFPYNFYQDFVTDPDDRIDHLYIDFLSTPPIIADAPLIYEVHEGSRIFDTLNIIDSMLKNQSREASRAISSKFERISDAPAGSPEEYQQALYALIQALLIMLSAEREIPFSSDSLVADSLKHMHRNYMHEINIKELAKNSGYHVNHFIRRFSAVMGMSPYAYLRRYRLYRAKELISAGMGISRTAELVGYENASSLSRALKAEL